MIGLRATRGERADRGGSGEAGEGQWRGLCSGVGEHRCVAHRERSLPQRRGQLHSVVARLGKRSDSECKLYPHANRLCTLRTAAAEGSDCGAIGENGRGSFAASIPCPRTCRTTTPRRAPTRVWPIGGWCVWCGVRCSGRGKLGLTQADGKKRQRGRCAARLIMRVVAVAIGNTVRRSRSSRLGRCCSHCSPFASAAALACAAAAMMRAWDQRHAARAACCLLLTHLLGSCVLWLR